MRLNVNTDAVVKFSHELEKLHKSAFPVTVRKTLNDAALDVKRNTMIQSSKESFINRSPNFFKSNSKVNFASGFNVNSMKSEVGFFQKRSFGNDFSVNDLEQQEQGGKIGGKSFIPLDNARKGGKSTNVKAAHRITKIGNVIRQSRMRGTKAQTFVKAVNKAGRGGHFIGGVQRGKNTLYKVLSLKKSGSFTLKPLYDYRRNRSVKVKSTGFMRRASMQSSMKMEKMYIANAKERILRGFK